MILHKFNIKFLFLKFAVSTFFLLSPYFALAQNPPQGSTDTEHSVDIKAESPSFTNYQDLFDANVNSVGQIPITVPIYTINLGKFSMPVYLSYDPSSVKVNSVASQIGFGWQLVAGGTITRQVNGLPDDVKQRFFFGYLSFDIAKEAERFTDADTRRFRTATKISRLAGNRTVFDQDLNRVDNAFDWDPDGYFQHVMDVQPDIFSVNVPSIASSFTFDKNRNAKFIEHKNYRISYTLSQEQNPVLIKGVNEFKVRDDQGNTFIFGLCDTVKSQGWNAISNERWEAYNSSPDFTNGSYANTWYLTKIVTAAGEEVSLRYETENCASPFSDWRARGYEGYANEVYGDYEEVELKIYGHQRRLTAIETRFEKIEFISGDPRQDLLTGKTLRGIKLYEKDGTLSVLKKAFELGHQYFETSGGESAYIPNKPLGPNVSTYLNPLKRLKLTSFREVGVNEDVLPAYSFEYNEGMAYPQLFSNMVDFWGYFNGVPNSHRFPKVYVYPQEHGFNKLSVMRWNSYTGPEYTLEGADRNPNPAAITTGLLRKIGLPSGGNITYTFESNEFYWKNQTFKGNGIRLSEVEFDDGIKETKKRKYIYTVLGTTISSGKLYDLPQFAYTEKIHRYSGPGRPEVNLLSNLTDHSSVEFFKFFTWVKETPSFYACNGGDSKTSYSVITEEIPGNGKIIREFSTEGEFGAHSYSIHSDYNQTGPGQTLKAFQVSPVKWVEGYHFITSEVLEIPGGIENLNMTGMVPELYSYPYIRLPNLGWNRGQLMKETVYDVNNAIKTERLNEYEVLNCNDADSICTIRGVQWANPTNCTLSTVAYPVWWGEWWWYGTYNVIADVKKVLKRSVLTAYLNGGSLASETRYSYNKNGSLKFTETFNSDGKRNRTTRVYPNDIPIIYSYYGDLEDELQAILELQERNQIAEPVEIYTQVLDANGNVKGVSAATHVQYNLYHNLAQNMPGVRYPNSVVLPGKIFNVLESDLITNFNPVRATGNIFSKDPYYQETVSYGSYAKGSIPRHYKHNNKDYYIYTDHESKRVIAEVQGNIGFYESFESNSLGSGPDQNARNGKYCAIGDYTINFIKPLNIPYVLTYWYRQAGVWKFSGEVNYTSNSMLLALGDAIDDVCIFPKNGSMTTYAYNSLGQLSCTTDSKGYSHWYHYDNSGRLKQIRDNQKNIIKQICYKYAVGNDSCDPILIDLAFTGFETSDQGGWTYPTDYIYQGDGFQGQRSYILEGNGKVSKLGLSSSKRYKLSLYYKYDTTVNGELITPISNVNGWNYAVVELSGIEAINIDFEGLIDNVLLQEVHAD